MHMFHGNQRQEAAVSLPPGDRPRVVAFVLLVLLPAGPRLAR